MCHAQTPSSPMNGRLRKACTRQKRDSLSRL